MSYLRPDARAKGGFFTPIHADMHPDTRQANVFVHCNNWRLWAHGLSIDLSAGSKKRGTRPNPKP